MFRNLTLERIIFLAVVGLMSVIAFSFTLDAEAEEGINRQIPFSGFLKSSPSGRPVTGTRDMVFRIYDAPTDGAVLWTGNHTGGNGNAVTIDDGNFSVMLGSGTGNEMTLDFTDDTYYVGVTVGTDSEMTPRERLGASPYAFNADFLDGLNSTQFLKVNNPLTIATSTDTALLALTQSGVGNFASFFDGASAELFSVLGTGEVLATKFQGTADDVNTFFGWFDVQGSQPSYFGAGLSTDESVTVADGAGISFGNGNGIFMYQDASVLSGIADLVLAGSGPDETGYVNLTTPGGLWLTPNNFNGCTDGCEPALILDETGFVELKNTGYGDLGDRQLRLNFADGVVVTNGDFTVNTGNVVFETGNLTLPEGSLRIENGNLQLDMLVDVSALAVDSFGNLIDGSMSDERLKENIRTIDDALEAVLDLRGVRYEWRDEARFGERTEVGFIAQEVEEVLPEVVRDTGEYLSVNTKNIIAVVVEAMKEMYGKMEVYFSRTEALEREVEVLRREVEMLRGERLPVVREELEPAPSEFAEDATGETSEVPAEEIIGESIPPADETVEELAPAVEVTAPEPVETAQ